MSITRCTKNSLAPARALQAFSPGSRAAKSLGAALKSLTFLLGHLRLKNLRHAFAPENARQRKRDTVFGIVRADRNYDNR